MKHSQRILRNFASLLFSGITSQGVNFLVLVFVARKTGVEIFGKISFASVVVSYFLLLIDLGLPILGTKKIARETSLASNLISNILVVRILLSCLALPLLAGFCWGFGLDSGTNALIGLFAIGLVGNAIFLEWLFQGLERMGEIFVSRFLGVALYGLLVVLFLEGRGDFFLVALFQSIGSLAASMYLLYRTREVVPDLSWGFRWKSSGALLFEAFPIGLTMLLGQALYNVNPLLLGFLRSEEEVGLYSVAYRVIQFFTLILGIYLRAVFPMIAHFRQSSPDGLRKTLELSQKLLIVCAVPLGFGGFFLGEDVLAVCFGTQFLGAAPVFRYLIWIPLFQGLNGILAWAMLGCDSERRYLKILVLQALVHLIVAFFFIPSHGAVGACWATLAAEIVGFPLYYREFGKIVRISILAMFFKPLACALVMSFGIQMVTGLSFVWKFLFGCFLYLTAMAILKGFSDEELDLAKKMFRPVESGASNI